MIFELAVVRKDIFLRCANLHCLVAILFFFILYILGRILVGFVYNKLNVYSTAVVFSAWSLRMLIENKLFFFFNE